MQQTESVTVKDVELSPPRESSLTIVLGFLALGLTTGFLTGMSSSPLAVSMIALLFAFSGGSAVTLLAKLSGRQTHLVGALLLALSIGTLVGCCGGVVVTENRLLTFRHLVPKHPEGESQKSVAVPEKYLKSADTTEIQVVLNRWVDGVLTDGEAKARIKEIVSR